MSLILIKDWWIKIEGFWKEKQSLEWREVIINPDKIVFIKRLECGRKEDLLKLKWLVNLGSQTINVNDEDLELIRRI
ncbi:MAG: hypothetical protein AABY07_05805 [Nanoarchaeota archaeon]